MEMNLNLRFRDEDCYYLAEDGYWYRTENKTFGDLIGKQIVCAYEIDKKLTHLENWNTTMKLKNLHTLDTPSIVDEKMYLAMYADD